MSSGTLYRVVVVRTDVLERISPPSSGFLRVIGPHRYSVRTVSPDEGSMNRNM
jgi:hypothetical protein